MSEVVQIGDATLYHGDCLEILPTLDKVDAVVTDPPYGLADRWVGGGKPETKGWKFDPAEARKWDREAPEIVLSFPLLSDQVIIWGGNYFALPPSRCWLVWDKKQPDTFTTGQAELAWSSIDKPIRVFRMAQCEMATHDHKEHPTQKPLRLMEWCLNWINGDMVLDPFMGSGTTGVACANLGRKFIGIEIEKKYFDIACERIDAAYAQGRLFA